MLFTYINIFFLNVSLQQERSPSVYTHPQLPDVLLLPVHGPRYAHNTCAILDNDCILYCFKILVLFIIQHADELIAGMMSVLADAVQ